MLRSHSVRVVTRGALILACAAPAGAQDLLEYSREEALRRQDPLSQGIAVEDVAVVELTLDDAQRIALENNLGLEIEEVATDVARFNAVGIWGAFDPILTANGSLTDSERPSANQIAGAQVLETNTQAFDVGLTLPVITGGSLALSWDHSNEESNSQFQFANVTTTDAVTVSFTQPLLSRAWMEYATSQQRESGLVYQQQIERFRQARQDLLLSVHNAYWDLMAAIEFLEVAQVTLDLGREQLGQNERRLEAGVGTEVEVLQAKANVAVRVEEWLAAKVAVAEAVDVLKGILWPGTQADTWDRELVPSTSLPDADTRHVVPWRHAVDVALNRRSNLRQQRTQIAIQEEALTRARSERWPVLDLVLSATGQGVSGQSDQARQDAFAFEFPTTSAALSFSFPLLNRSARHAQRVARANLRSARLAYQQAESQVVSEVRQAVRQVQYQAIAVEAATVSLDLAERQLDAEEARLREGLSTTFEVLDFQQQLASALSSLTAARVAYAKALAGLRAAEGWLGESRP